MSKREPSFIEKGNMVRGGNKVGARESVWIEHFLPLRVKTSPFECTNGEESKLNFERKSKPATKSIRSKDYQNCSIKTA